MREMKTLSVVVPVYRGEKLIAPFLVQMDKVALALRDLGMGMQLIFVDDGSLDGTLSVLRTVQQERDNVTIVKLTRNFGAMAASKIGLQQVTGDCFTIMAVDLQDPPEVLVEMAKRWKAGAKYIVGERVKRADPWITRLLATTFYRMVRLFLVKGFPLGGIDFGFWDASLLPYLRGAGKHANRALLSHWLGFRPEYIQYVRPKSLGASHWSLARRLVLFVDTFIGFSVLPIRVISGIGFIVALASFTYALVILYGGVTGKIQVPGYASSVVLLSFLLGLTILLLGVLGEYVWRIFDILNHRPDAVVDEVYVTKASGVRSALATA